MHVITSAEREPKLSEETLKILYRSMGKELSDEPNDHTATHEIFRYKYKTMQLLLNCDDLLRALHYPKLSDLEPLNGDLFRDVAVYDYMKLPPLRDKVQPYICFEVYLTQGGQRTRTLTLNIRIVVHDRDCKTDWAINRVDLIDLIITHLIDWSNEFGATMVKTSDIANMSNGDFYFRDLTFTANIAPNDYHLRGQK